MCVCVTTTGCILYLHYILAFVLSPILRYHLLHLYLYPYAVVVRTFFHVYRKQPAGAAHHCSFWALSKCSLMCGSNSYACLKGSMELFPATHHHALNQTITLLQAEWWESQSLLSNASQVPSLRRPTAVTIDSCNSTSYGQWRARCNEKYCFKIIYVEEIRYLCEWWQPACILKMEG